MAEAAHRLKSWPEQFAALVDGRKAFDLRRADREFAVGDAVQLQEWDPAIGAYTGREASRVVSFVTSAEHPCAASDAGLAPGYCILGYAPPHPIKDTTK